MCLRANKMSQKMSPFKQIGEYLPSVSCPLNLMTRLRQVTIIRCVWYVVGELGDSGGGVEVILNY